VILWTACYQDGTTLAQNGDNGTRHGYQDIDRDNLEAFILHWPDGQPVAVIDFSNDSDEAAGIGKKRLIWRKRHSHNSHNEHMTFHMAGWQRKVNGRNVQSILYINDDTGAIVMGGQWIDNSPMMRPIVPLDTVEADLIE